MSCFETLLDSLLYILQLMCFVWFDRLRSGRLLPDPDVSVVVKVLEKCQLWLKLKSAWYVTCTLLVDNIIILLLINTLSLVKARKGYKVHYWQLLNGLWSKPQIKVYLMPDVGISAFSMKLIKWKDTLSTCCLCNPFWN